MIVKKFIEISLLITSFIVMFFPIVLAFFFFKRKNSAVKRNIGEIARLPQ